MIVAMVNDHGAHNHKETVMCNKRLRHLCLMVAGLWLGITAAAVMSVCGCRQLPQADQISSTPVAGLPEPDQRLFASDEDAAKSLIQAVAEGNTDEVSRIFGPAARQDLLSGDAVQDRRGLEQFAKRANESWRLEKQEERKSILYIGTKDCPFSIPIIQVENGKWFFDAAAGKAEILARRIGRNELEAIKMCRAFVQYQQEYASKYRDDSGVLKYAQRYFSAPGKKDGLYWEAEPGEEESPAAPMIEAATLKGYYQEKGATDSCAYMGYVYRILAKQGPAAPGGRYDYVVNGNMIAGFALAAYPSKHGSSGIMTFIINHQGTLYEKNLGPKTQEIAEKMTEYDPDGDWRQARE